MNQSQEQFEFRVLTGCHAGVSAPAQAGMQVGADLESDIILADPGLPEIPVRLNMDGEQWGFNGTPSCALNEPHRLGPIWVTLARAEQPWPSPPAQTTEPSSEADTHGDGHGVDDSDDSADEPVSGVGADSHASSVSDEASQETAVMVSPHERPIGSADTRPDSPTKRWRRRLVYVLVLLMCVLALAVALGVWRPGVSTAHIEGSGSSEPSRNVAQIWQVLQQLGYADRVDVVETSSGQLRVQGWVDGPADQDAIAQAMTRVWPMPALRLRVAAQVLDDVRHALSDVMVYVEVSLLDGTIHVEGVASDHDGISGISQRVAQRYPDVPVLTGAVVTPSELVLQLTEALGKVVPADGVQMAWRQGYLEVDVDALDLQVQQAVQSLAAEFNRQYWGRVTLTGLIVQGPELPFAIRSVVSGPQPYVVLPDGGKILLGGSHHGFRLVSVEPGRVIFEGNDNVVLPR